MIISEEKKEDIMKKLFLIFSITLLTFTLFACEELGSSEKVRIALLTDPIGQEQFLLQAYNMVVALADEYDYEWVSVECADLSAWDENARAVASEGYDLIIGVGWQSGGPFGEIADEFPDSVFAVVDTISPNQNVASFGFNEAEGSYVMGVLIGHAFSEDNLFGYVGNFQNQASYKYRWGFSEGVKSVNPEATFIYNYTNSFQDTSAAYEFASQQRAAGARFIVGGVSSAANSGIYQAALDFASSDQPIYTSGLSVDQTTVSNPHIVTGLLKNTGAVTEFIISNYFSDTLSFGANILGLSEGAFGVVHVTTDSANFWNEDVVPQAAIDAAKIVAQQIINGELEIEAPLE
jgi:basic membrane protein A and related proteins